MPIAARVPVKLTVEQQDAFERLLEWSESGSFQCALLHGVTGSGKTEL
jgi:primosomal protein N'